MFIFEIPSWSNFSLSKEIGRNAFLNSISLLVFISIELLLKYLTFLSIYMRCSFIYGARKGQELKVKTKNYPTPSPPPPPHEIIALHFEGGLLTKFGGISYMTIKLAESSLSSFLGQDLLVSIQIRPGVFIS